MGAMTETIAHTVSPSQTKAVAAALSACLQPGDVVLFNGSLGAGKTQFVQGVAQGLGVEAAVVSPTFNLLITYTGGRLPLHHFDLYRLAQPEELDDIAFFETVEGEGASFVEWAERFPEDMPEDALLVTMSLVEGEPEHRVIGAAASGVRSEELLEQWRQAVQAALP